MYSSKASHFLFPLSFSGKTTHRFTIQSDVQTITISCMSSVYQLRSSEDQSSFSPSPLLVYSPHLGLSGLEETEPWVWGLEYLSAGGQIKDHSYSVSVCMCVLCVYFLKLFLSLLTSAPAIAVIWYQDPTVCKSIQYSLQSLQRRTRGQE